MDKNKGRTDMLAAGRKKLQQFRQKKDGKGSGSQGKSSKMPGKSAHREADAEAESGSSKPESSPLVPEHKDSDPPVVVTSASQDGSDPPISVTSASHDESEAPTAVTSASHSPEAVAPDTASIEESTAIVEVSEHNETEVVSTEKSVTPVVGLDATNSGEETASDTSIPVKSSSEPPSVDSTGESLDLENNALLSREDIPDSSLVQTRGDQVTDLGSMQEADGLDGSQTDYSCELKLDGVPEVGKTSEASPSASTEETHVKTSRETEQPESVNEVPMLEVTKVSNGLSGVNLGSAVENHQYEENPEPSSEKDETQDATQGYTETEFDSLAGARAASLPDLSSISLSQLTNLIKGLSEEEFDHVHESRRTRSGVDRGSRHLLERLKEELVLTNFTKDISQMQLDQHSELQSEFDNDRRRLVDEIALLRASLQESREKSHCLFEELTGSRDELQGVISAREELRNQLRSSQSDVQELSEGLSGSREELQAIISAREELQNQFRSSQSDVQKLSGRVNELQIDLERSQGDFSSCTTELAVCKNLVTSLQSEIEILNGCIAPLTEDRNKLREEKDSQTGEIGKLMAELEECKTSLALLHSENLNMAASFSSLDAVRKMVEEEKENLRTEHKKLSEEISNSKEVASVLQLENSGLKESLDLLTDERTQFDEDKRYFAQENERLSSELIVFQDKILTEQRERERSEAELKEMSMRLEEIIEENIFLSSSLEVHKARLLEADRTRYEMPLQINEAVDQGEISEQQSVDRHITASVIKPVSDRGAERSFCELEVPTAFLGFDSMRVHLEEAEKILHQLEKANEGIQAQSMSFDMKSSAPGVSKLIQAFESKVQSDEQEAEQMPSAENQSSVYDPLKLMKEEIRNLKALFNQLVVDARDASGLFKEECNSRRAADLSIGVLKDQYEASKEDHTDSLEAKNIELLVICEVLKQYEGSAEAKINEVEVLCEASKQEVFDLKAENAQLGSSLSTYESRVCELQVQLNDLQQSLREMVAEIGDRAYAMEKEVSDRVLSLEQDWNSTLTQVFEIVQKLGESTTSLSSAALLPSETLDVVSYVDNLVNQTIEVIEALLNKIEDAQAERGAISTSFKELNNRCVELGQKNDLAAGTLHNIYFQLKKLVSLYEYVDESERKVEDEKISDLSDYANYRNFFEQLEHNLIERLEFESAIKKLNSELMERKTEFGELERGCMRADVVSKLIESIEGVLKVEDADPMEELPSSRFETLVSTVLQKYCDAQKQLCLSKNEFRSSVTKLTELEEELQQSISAGLQHETEISILKESLNQAEEVLANISSELEKKTQELEQSEQRVSSIREKLSIAVAKGKGLVVQRDSKNNLLAEMSSELERCVHELQLKNGKLNEVEEKLKVYSEAGERIEALESELSYIRNSATGLRESFLLKDSALQRIEEILENLDLPEHFHSRDILEKVEWLARSASGNNNNNNNNINALPAGEWDQKSSYSETGFVSAEPWKGDAQAGTNIGEDLKKKYEELQIRFYGLAEQNEMLEQSLMERNDLVQRWEELLDKIDMPPHLRSSEPEDKIQWLGRALSEACDDADSLQEKLVNFENLCGSLTADLEDSHRRIYEHEINHETISREKEHISERLEILSNSCEKISSKATEYEAENKRLQSEVTRLEESHNKLSARVTELESENKRLQSEVNYLQENVAEMLGNKDQMQSMEGDIRRLQGLVGDTLQDPETQDQVSSASSIESLEASLIKLLENYNNFSSEKQVLSRGIDLLGDETMSIQEATIKEKRDNDWDSDAVILKKELDEALEELIHVKGERNLYIEKQQSLECEIEVLVKAKEELESLLSQEAQKLASTRENLTVAVRRGKMVVQNRDSLKQKIEEKNAEVEYLKSEIEIRESKLSDYENRFRELSSNQEKIGVLESEVFSLRNCLAETGQHLQETGRTLSLIMNNLSTVNVGNGADSTDPVEKSEQIVNLCRDLHSDLTSSEEESRKSKRAAELLLAELNEVQDRNDNIQEELSEVTNERDIAKAALREAHSRLDELYDSRSSEQRNQFSELKALKSGVDQFRRDFNDLSNLLVDMFSKDLEFLQSLEKSIGMSPNPTDGFSIPAFNVGRRSTSSDSKGLFASWFDSNANEEFDGNSVSEICVSVGLQLQELNAEVGVLKEKLKRHSSSAQGQASSLSKALAIAQRELISQNELHEALKREITQLASASQEKDDKLVMMQTDFVVVFEVLSGLITEVQSTKSDLLGINKDSGEIAFQGAGDSGGPAQIPSAESVKIVADKLLFAVRDFANVKAEFMEGDKRQMKSAIADLQRELQEKDVQKERICMDLVAQIKVAEAAAARSSADFHSSSRQVDELENRLKQVERERENMEQKANELLDQQENSKELQQMVRSLTDTITAKDQEIESLMQALDEEETQMEDQTKRIGELERVLQQKNSELENIETSRGKITKKLSITVSKFDELHELSASLLAEVEKLQSQLQERDADISFLRQEVTRCTNEVLVSNKRGSDEILEFSTWLDMMISNAGMQLKNDDPVQEEQKELLKKKIESVILELVEQREVAQSKDTLLQSERSKVSELARKEEILQRSLRDQESRLNLLEGVGASEETTGTTSEIVEVEPLINKWTVPGPSVTSQVRSLRKANNDQVAIAIDMDHDSGNGAEDEDDDKVHGFKSLTTSRIVPRFTRPVAHMVDGLWVSCDRALMRQPAFRLGIIIYWAVLHALLATLAI